MINLEADLNSIPVIGWITNIVLMASLAVPFYFMWNYVAPTYFYWLPDVYQNIPFWDCVWLFTVISILQKVLIPKLASINQNVSNKEKNDQNRTK